ncbi:hypothetical protein DFP72DRAFT_1051252 [Ephemerocybe angulata]|uniref:Uncharacterized protein n=1 Tax=Ephemerocybe angulata TaxID=980116 RepID=A0A8H6HF09_9AGAR|nr:hypothetical protein DFP72DRAFT_1051252 [Tulosesus angulatus]
MSNSISTQSYRDNEARTMPQGGEVAAIVQAIRNLGPINPASFACAAVQLGFMPPETCPGHNVSAAQGDTFETSDGSASDSPGSTASSPINLVDFELGERFFPTLSSTSSEYATASEGEGIPYGQYKGRGDGGYAGPTRSSSSIAPRVPSFLSQPVYRLSQQSYDADDEDSTDEDEDERESEIIYEVKRRLRESMSEEGASRKRRPTHIETFGEYDTRCFESCSKCSFELSANGELHEKPSAYALDLTSLFDATDSEEEEVFSGIGAKAEGSDDEEPEYEEEEKWYEGYEEDLAYEELLLSGLPSNFQ